MKKIGEKGGSIIDISDKSCCGMLRPYTVYNYFLQRIFNNAKRNRLQLSRISPGYSVLYYKITGYPGYHAIMSYYKTTFRQSNPCEKIERC